jgi:hypothetical protein
MEIKINAKIDYDFEKAQFYLAEWEVIKTDEYAGRTTLKKSPHKPGSQPICQRLKARAIPKHGDAK